MAADGFEEERQRMVEEQIRSRGVRDERVLAAMEEVPRHIFVPLRLRRYAYADRPLPIGRGQTISQPYIVARMTELLELKPSDRVLEIGAGSGYQAAILSKLVAEVVTVERLPHIAGQAREHLRTLGITNVKVVEGDGTCGYPPDGPYDGIIVTAAAPGVPAPLIEQLAPGGRLVIPVGGREFQELVRITREEEGPRRESFGGVCFVPLIGEYGW
ncbi:MAG: protein-L-isoaspartate(D-aspartate) O-methyltransferase [Methanoculleaceae archaeon]